ncbi:NAD(P)H-hydrate dehydratase [Ramlibacter sp.]|uniref:NAD(P)H-hydrate dehydratase n=1 Tax=Ramlibacter sp. TaxID=1917967 RepID=UPI003D0BCEC3
MHRIEPGPSQPLFDVVAVRRIEHAAAATLEAHTLMQRAGRAVARLALAVAPHARTIWIACGPGNNGGDGFEAAMNLQRWGKDCIVTCTGREDRLPPDAAASFARAREAGVRIAKEAPASCDLAIDALLGIGSARPLEGDLLAAAKRLNEGAAPVLAVDIPSGLSADTGMGESVAARWTLCLLALKPGLFTGRGRDACGELWFDSLDVALPQGDASAFLAPAPQSRPREHASHKGSYGDVAILGGAAGMTGAPLLAASAALHAGAGRVFVALLDGGSLAVDLTQPELMLRASEALALETLAVACGCGGGDAVRGVLPRVLSSACSLVLDADALNAVTNDPQLQTLLESRGRRGAPTVLTPHPLEAARLLARTTKDVQADRLSSARELARRFGCVVVLKGSGSVIARPRGTSSINPTGNAKLATAGTGDVLAGMIAARLASGAEPFEAASAAVYLHGQAADAWPADRALTASKLAGLARG